MTITYPYLLAHWPARTTPAPCISISSLSGLVKASSVMKIKLLGSPSAASACQTWRKLQHIRNPNILRVNKVLVLS